MYVYFIWLNEFQCAVFLYVIDWAMERNIDHLTL